MRLLTALAVFLMALAMSAQATERKREVGQWRLGLGVNSILSPDQATKPMIGAYSPDSLNGGGSFDGNYLTFSGAYVFSLDKDSRMRYPIELSYMRFSAAEVFLISSTLKTRWTNTVNMLSLSNGFEYDVLSFYEGTGYLFVGAAMDLNHFFGREFRYQLDYANFDEQDVDDIYEKDAAWRLGGKLTLGLQADFQDNVRFNITASAVSLNLLQINQTEGALMALLYPSSPLQYRNEKHVMTYRLAVNFIYLLYN